MKSLGEEQRLIFHHLLFCGFFACFLVRSTRIRRVSVSLFPFFSASVLVKLGSSFADCT